MLKKLLRTIFSPWGKVMLAAMLATASLLMYFPQGTVSATPIVQLNVLGFGSTSWSIVNIKPGDKGVEPVALQNVGSSPGNVIVWISNVVTTKSAAADPKFGTTPQIDKKLTLKVTGTGFSSTPATVDDFPKNASSPQKISLGRLEAGGTVNFSWEWNLPAVTDNDVQGDSVSFDINYMIDEIPPTTPEPVPAPVVPVVGRSIILDVPGATVEESLIGDKEKGVVTAGQMAASSPLTPISIEIPANAEVLNPDFAVLQAIYGDLIQDAVPDAIKATIYTEPITQEVSLPEGMAPVYQPVPLPEGWTLVSQIYEILGYTRGIAHHLTINPPADIILGYNPELLPENVDEISIFYYNESAGKWIQLQMPPGYIAAMGQAAAQVGHFSIFAVLAKGTGNVNPPIVTPTVPVGPETPTVPEVPVTPQLSAKFTVTNLVVNPSKIMVGERSTVTAIVTNIGGIAGEYTATLMLDGIPVDSRTVTLNAGENHQVSFNINPDLPGVYSIDISQQDGKLEVISLPTNVNIKSPTYWWLLLLAMAFVLLMTVLFRTGGVLAPAPATGPKRPIIPSPFVVAAIKEIIVMPVNPCAGIDRLLKFKAVAQYSNDAEEDITTKARWTVRDGNIARIDKKGLAVGLAPGITAVIASWHGQSGSTLIGVNCSIFDPTRQVPTVIVKPKVIEEIKAIIITPKDAPVVIGSRQRFKAVAEYADGTQADISERVVWTSTNDFVADIDGRGVATGYTAGVTAIIATFRGKRGITTLTVNKPGNQRGN